MTDPITLIVICILAYAFYFSLTWEFHKRRFNQAKWEAWERNTGVPHPERLEFQRRMQEQAERRAQQKLKRAERRDRNLAEKRRKNQD